MICFFSLQTIIFLVTFSKINTFTVVFSLYDIDKDGVISKQELLQVCYFLFNT